MSAENNWPLKCANCGRIIGSNDRPGVKYFCCVNCQVEWNTKKINPDYIFSQKVAHKCDQCRNIFFGPWWESSLMNMEKFCSRRCTRKYENEHFTVTCRFCRKRYIRPPKQPMRARDYCSQGCMEKHAEITQLTILNCPGCGENFTRGTNQVGGGNNYCSRECQKKFGESIRGKIKGYNEIGLSRSQAFRLMAKSMSLTIITKEIQK